MTALLQISDVQDREGRTGLSWATTRDDTESSRLLLGHGADVIKSNNRGFDPIHSAKSLPSLKLLPDHDVDIMSKTAVGATHLHFVSRCGRHDMIEPMVKAHADPNASDADAIPLICSTYDHQPKSTETLLKLGAKPKLAAKRSGLTALHFAVTDNQHDIIQQLLSHNADCTLKAEKERNIIHLAAIHGDGTTTDILSQARLMGIDPEARDSLGKTAREYFEERSEESAPGTVRHAFTVLRNTLIARRGLREDDVSLPEVFYDAIEEIPITRRTAKVNTSVLEARQHLSKCFNGYQVEFRFHRVRGVMLIVSASFIPLMTRLLYGLKELAFPILPLTDALASRIRDRLPEMVSANVSERRYLCTSKGVALRSNISQRLSRFGQRIRLQSWH